MRFRRREPRTRVLGVDMTPMIDIVFQLLIFFLTTAQLAELSRTDIELPAEAGEQGRAEQAAALVVNLLADGSIVVGQQTLDLEGLERVALATVGRERRDGEAPQPLVRADRNAPSTALNAVLRRLQRAGFTSVRIGTNPPVRGGGR